MSSVVISEIICSHPVPKFPYYHAKIKITNRTDSVYYVNKLIANRVGVRDYSIFNNGDFVFEPIIKPMSVTFIMARADWSNNDTAHIEMELIEESSKDVVSLSKQAAAPGYGGYWNKDWKYYFSVVANDRHGVERVNEPIHLSTTLYADRITSPKDEVRVVEVDSLTGLQREIPSQVYGISKPYTAVSNESIQNSISFDLAFFANVNSKSGKVYLVFYGNEKASRPQYMSKLVVTGTAPGLTIENEYYTINLHGKSGSLNQITTKLGVNKLLEHQLETNGSVHWNPGVYSPPTAWTHTSDWESLTTYFEESGPVFLMTQRGGPLPLYDQTAVSQSYIFYADAPFIRVNSVFDVNEGTYIQALRNGEIVFNHDVITSFALRDKLGEIKHTVVTDLPRFEEIALTYDADIPWAAFYNPDDGVGFAEITLNTSAMRRNGGLAKLEHHHQYVNWGPWCYLTRNLIFPYGSQNPQRMSYVPDTSTYFEDMLFLPFKMPHGAGKDEQFRQVEEAYQMFINPLNVQVEHETDKRVPAQFVLGPRLAGEIKESEDKPWPITLDKQYTRFRQSPILLNEIYFKEKDGKYYYR